jgi:hypothetical protein
VIAEPSIVITPLAGSVKGVQVEVAAAVVVVAESFLVGGSQSARASMMTLSRGAADRQLMYNEIWFSQLNDLARPY